MLRKIKLIGLSIAFVPLLGSNAMAACEFTVDGVRLLCSTCTCAKLTADDVKFESCIDWLAKRVPSTPKRYDKIQRYSDFFVTLHSRNGEEFPLASDAAQKQFDEMYAQPNFKELFLSFKAVPGVISVERVEQLAKDLQVPVVYVNGRPEPTTTQSGVPRFEVIPQFSFLSLNRPQSIIVGHMDVAGIIVGHAENAGIVIGHTDCGGIVIQHADQSGIIVGHADQQGIVRNLNCAGIGARFTYNATRTVALETVANFFPKLSPDSFVPGLIIVGHTDSNGIIVGHADASGFQMQFGVKVGKRFGSYGIFGKAAPGLIRFSDVSRLVGTETVIINPALPPVTLGVVSSESKTYFSTDVGGVVEFYPSRRILIRFDLGDTIIRYGPRAGLSVSNTIIQLPAETKHNFQFNAGVGFRF